MKTANVIANRPSFSTRTIRSTRSFSSPKPRVLLPAGIRPVR